MVYKPPTNDSFGVLGRRSQDASRQQREALAANGTQPFQAVRKIKAQIKKLEEQAAKLAEVVAEQARILAEQVKILAEQVKQAAEQKKIVEEQGKQADEQAEIVRRLGELVKQIPIPMVSPFTRSNFSIPSQMGSILTATVPVRDGRSSLGVLVQFGSTIVTEMHGSDPGNFNTPVYEVWVGGQRVAIWGNTGGSGTMPGATERLTTFQGWGMITVATHGQSQVNVEVRASFNGTPQIPSKASLQVGVLALSTTPM